LVALRPIRAPPYLDKEQYLAIDHHRGGLLPMLGYLYPNVAITKTLDDARAGIVLDNAGEVSAVVGATN
jgi:hypothetical protein